MRTESLSLSLSALIGCILSSHGTGNGMLGEGSPCKGRIGESGPRFDVWDEGGG